MRELGDPALRRLRRRRALSPRIAEQATTMSRRGDPP
jgi:hypothetical protein